MPGDGILRIGATVDKTGVEAGLSGFQDGVQTTVQSIAVQVEETCARTKAAWNKLGDDVKAAAQSVSAESLKVAEATKAQTAALADLRRASVLSRDAKLDEATSTGILAAAQVKVAASSAAVAAAKKEEATSVATAAEEEALSSNVIIAAFQRAAFGVRESCTLIQEKLVETAETGKLSAEGITAGFAGLGSLLGAGIFVGFAAHFLDETSKMEIELAHLAEKTGITIQYLAGLQQVVRESGGDWDAVATGLMKMNKSLADSTEPSKALINALGGINVKIEDLKGLQPEAKLQLLAIAFAASENAGNKAAAATAVFSKGGQALIPVLNEQGAALEENVREHAKLIAITNKSLDAAFLWQQTTARLSAEFRSVMVPAIALVEETIAGLLSVVKGLDAVIWAVIDAIGALAKALMTVGGVIYDAMTGNFGRMRTDAKELTHDLAMIWEDYGRTAGQRFKETAALWNWKPPEVARPKPPGDTGADGDDGLNGVAAAAALKKDVADLNALKIAHYMTIEEERDFWAKKLAAAHEGSDEFIALQAKLAPLMNRSTRAPSTKADISADEEELTRIMSAHRLTIDEEVAFWRRKLAVNSGGINEYVAILKKVNQAQGKGPELESADLSHSGVDGKAYIKAAEERVKGELQAYRSQAEEKMRMASEDYAEVEKNTAFEVSMGRMSGEQRIAALRLASNQENQIRQQQSKFIEMLDMNDQKAYERLLKQEEQSTRLHLGQIAQLNQRTALETARNWQHAFDKMSDTFSHNTASWILGQQSLAQSWSNTLVGMTRTVVENLLKQAIAYITHAAMVEAVQERQKMKDAAEAARKAYIAVSAIPVVGPFLAPIAAAGAFAAVEAFEQGGIVGGRGAVPILAHAGERVLTPSQTRNVERIANQDNSSNSSQANHFHYSPQISGIDGASVESMARKHSATFTREAMRQLRLRNKT